MFFFSHCFQQNMRDNNSTSYLFHGLSHSNFDKVQILRIMSLIGQKLFKMSLNKIKL